MQRKFIITLLLLLCVHAYAHSQDEKSVRSKVEDFLLLHNAYTTFDSSIDVKKNYSLEKLKKVYSKEGSITIYTIGFLLSHSSGYLLIVDNRKNIFHFYGQNNLSSDLLSMKKFLDKRIASGKHKIRLRCYNYLIENSYSPYGNYETE